MDISHIITCLAVLTSVVLLALAYSKIDKNNGGNAGIKARWLHSSATCKRPGESCSGGDCCPQDNGCCAGIDLDPQAPGKTCGGVGVKKGKCITA